MIRRSSLGLGALVALVVSWLVPAADGEVLAPARERYAVPNSGEIPDFQRHILPMLSRLGCNGRACHGSFQGQGGFRLSLFGYDFQSDHDVLLADGEGRVDLEVPELSLVLQKPTLAVPHEGGKVLEEGSWEYAMLARWIEAGAQPADGASTFARLEVRPAEIVFDDDGQRVPLRVVAHWEDGSSEDVTCLTRFQTNDEAIAVVDREGVVTSTGAGDTHVVAFYDNGVVAVPVLRPVSDRVGPRYPEVPTPTEIDRLVVRKLRTLGIVPSELCTDEEFLRRVSLDLTGTLPTPAEVAAFLADPDPARRARKVDELLERPTYAAWWASRLSDILGNAPGNFQGQNGAQEFARQWHRWLSRRIAENEPYDELVAGIVLATSRGPGQSYEDYAAEMSSYFRQDDPADYADREFMPHFWARRNLRQPQEKALAFSYAFLGVRLDCAQCHKHPFDQWTQQDFRQFRAFFEPIRYGLSRDGAAMRRELFDARGFDPSMQNANQFRRALYRELVVERGEPFPWEEVFIQRRRTATRRPGQPAAPVNGGARVVTPKLLGGAAVDLADVDDPREPLMAWLRHPENPYFARAFVNRVWAAYFGRGIVDPPDDQNLANPPSNGPLLDDLATGFVAHGFDMKWLHREITNSATYQRSWRTNPTNALDERNFSHALIRRLPAEVVLDAIDQATAGSAALARAAENLDGRRIGPDGTTRLTRGAAGYADRVFGRSSRDTNCDCSRSDEPNLLQLIYLQNDPEVLGALDRPDGWVAEIRETGRGAADHARSAPDLGRQVRQLETRLKRLAGGDAPPAARRRIEARLTRLRAQLREQKRFEVTERTFGDAEVEDLVRQAYLRTLSRSPDARELAVARKHIATAGDGIAGLRDVLWALLNTKEFLTNH